MKTNAVAVRFAEVFLKGGRRNWFAGRLRESLDRQVKRAGPWRVREAHDQFLVVHREAAGEGLPGFRVTPALTEALQRTFGVVLWVPCRIVAREIGVIESEVMAIADEHVPGKASFKIEARRADKEFPLNSVELNRRLGALVFLKHRVPGKMKDPAVAIQVHVTAKSVLLSVEAFRGPGGLPVGTGGRVLLLLSGGIDSPVAGWQLMRRGCDVDAVHFDAAPWTKPEARKKALDLATHLAGYQSRLRLWVVPFGAVQTALRDKAPGRMLVVLYRRMMMRIATRLATAAGAQALVTGENLGQVASQTLENLTVIEDAAGLPILRPLLAFEKQETVDLARRIGTYETSILPFDDCCSLFVPPHPETAARLEKTLEIEAGFDVESLVEQAVTATEELVITVDPPQPEAQAQPRPAPTGLEG
jgi:tRNA uracil 4-sulfurtransferase